MTTLDRLTAALADRYRLDRELGQGGMATVYLAHDLRHDRDVAIKVLHPELGAALGGDRFLSEIRTTARLQHPHILPLLDSGDADGLLYYVMPLVTGETLRARLERETQLPIDDAVLIAREVADALGYAHSLGVIHRDIKPENILLQGGHALVADFGIALAVQQAGAERMTQTGLSLGTPQYMSPEQAMGEKVIDARSDLYALGAVLYEMLTGEPPFTGATLQAVVAKVISADPEPPTLIRKAVPPQVEAVVLQALEKLPADRFASARDLTQALARTGTTHGGVARHRATAPVGAGTAWRPIALTAIGVAALATAFAVWSQRRVPSADGPIEYDVAFPDSVGMTLDLHSGFAVTPAGNAVVFPVVNRGVQSFWMRSLLDGTLTHLDGTDGARQPTISRDGATLAFMRDGATDRTIEVMPLTGGAAQVLARVRSPAMLNWLPDGRLLSVEDDGRSARWMDAAGGPSSVRPLSFCILPSLLPDATRLLCGGGAQKEAYLVDTGNPGTQQYLSTGLGDSTLVFGSHFQLVDDAYLVYLSKSGDLLAAPVDLTTRHVGRSVRMVTGLSVREYSGAGSFVLAASGTLVYAQGANHAVGHLVRAGERSVDTLPVAPDAFKVYAISPDGRELAAVVDVIDGQELRVYDLGTGKFVALDRGMSVLQPVWSPAGDRLLYARSMSRDTVAVLIRTLNSAQAPREVLRAGGFEGYNWLPDGRVFAAQWTTGGVTLNSVAVAVHVDRTPVRVDTVARDVGFVRSSPDGRWLTYSGGDLNSLWLEPLPANGTRYQLHGGSQIQDFFWLSPTELVFMAGAGVSSLDRVTITPSGSTPVSNRRRWLNLVRALDTDGLSSTPTGDGRIVYLQAAIEPPARSLRVIPGWVARMKRAVDAANK